MSNPNPSTSASSHLKRHMRIFAGLTALCLLAGCASPWSQAGNVSKDRAFLTYWPRPENDSRVRVAVKDLIDMKGLVTTGGSEYLAKNSPPAARDAECLEGVRSGSVWIVGKTNAGELGTGVSGANDFFGTPRNPLAKKYRLVPGGSSSGSAVAVASGMADVALGTDTAGSIRIPAASCGVAGLKTTFGLISLKGVLPLSPKNLDTVGPIARDVPGLVKGMDLLDPDFAAQYRKANASRSSITVGRLYVPDTAPEIDQAVDAALAASGFHVVRLNDAFVKTWTQGQEDGKVVAAADAWLTDREYLNRRGLSNLTKTALRFGEIQYNTGYAQALKRRPELKRAFRKVFTKVDFIATPTIRKVPPRISRFGRTALLELRMFEIQNTVAVNFAGNPALAMPIPMDDEMVHVTSLQLVGPPFSEAKLLHAGQLVESRLPK
jgi:amidase